LCRWAILNFPSIDGMLSFLTTHFKVDSSETNFKNYAMLAFHAGGILSLLTLVGASMCSLEFNAVCTFVACR